MFAPTKSLKGMSMTSASLKRILTALPLAALVGAASANDRHFAYTYETAVLPPGSRELEVSTTLREGREQFYSELDHRLEFETGVAENLMTAFYLNWNNVTAQVDDPAAGAGLETALEWQGVSSEWKWKLMDPVADAVGLALYAEVSYNTTGFEIEPKVLFDKKIGDWLFAANLLSEFEYESGIDETELEEIAPEVNLGVTRAIGKRFHAGLELRQKNAFMKTADGSGEEELELNYSSLFLGPSISYGGDTWWASFTLLPQLPALYKKDGGSILVLDDHEKINARLLFSFHL
jgi:hypothetical protein